MRTLTPIYDRRYYHEPAARVLEHHWYETLFEPLLNILREKLAVKGKIYNSKASLKTALEKGKVQWYDGFFTGPFSAAVSKDIRSMGGTWNKNKKAFAIALYQMPADIKAAISAGHAKVNRTVEDLYKKLDEVQSAPPKTMDFTKSFERVTSDLNAQFAKTVKAKDEITISPEFTPAMKATLAEGYSKNLNHFAGEFTEDEIWKLRQSVTSNVMEGFRSDRLVKVIEAQFGVTRRKAKFLARQETSLMVAKYRQTRYEEVGLKRYKWSTSHDERVRPDHKELNNRIFAYLDPPVTDRATQARNNPGEDFNCRCIAIPILED